MRVFASEKEAGLECSLSDRGTAKVQANLRMSKAPPAGDVSFDKFIAKLQKLAASVGSVRT